MIGTTVAVNVGASRTQLVSCARAWGVVVANNGLATIYIGGQAVTTSTGIPIAAAGSVSIDALEGGLGAVAAVAQTAPTNTRVLIGASRNW